MVGIFQYNLKLVWEISCQGTWITASALADEEVSWQSFMDVDVTKKITMNNTRQHSAGEDKVWQIFKKIEVCMSYSLSHPPAQQECHQS